MPPGYVWVRGDRDVNAGFEWHGGHSKKVRASALMVVPRAVGYRSLACSRLRSGERSLRRRRLCDAERRDRSRRGRPSVGRTMRAMVRARNDMALAEGLEIDLQNANYGSAARLALTSVTGLYFFWFRK